MILPPNKQAAAPTRPPPITTTLAAAAPVEADAAADPDLVALDDPDAAPEPAACVALAVVLLAPLPTLALPVAPAPPVNFSAPAVTTTNILATSLGSYVVVLLPGKFASLPPADSLHTAPTPPPRPAEGDTTQSWVAVKSLPGLGSDSSMCQVEGP
ncbi:hypothetical protein N0V83_009272 [Neocucurbitaria cava]|uniref:Uncharacterized protein n=1 Tax=Neocucurbitaria cava TaxID=798079 RepID=A0A9W8Y3M9_9PLEO|nr:hypothetical protein N0V83_009272 [Neocucurbitaria cava]